MTRESYTSAPMEKPLPRHPLAFAAVASKPVRGWAVLSMLAVISAATSDSLTNIILKNLTNTMMEAVGGGDFRAVWVWCIAFTAAYTFGGLLWRVSGLGGMRWLTGLKTEAYRILFQYLSHHSARYFSDRFAGALASKVSQVADGTSGIVQTLLWQFLTLSIMLIVGIVAAGSAGAGFVGIICAWAAVYMSVNVVLVLRKRRHAVALAKSTASLRGTLVDSATNIAAVQQAAHQEMELLHLGTYIDAFASASIRNWMFAEGVLVTGNVLQMFFIGGTLAYAAIQLQRGLITVGDVTMLTGIMIQLVRQIFYIGNQLNIFMDNYGQAAEGLQELLQPHEITDVDGAGALNVRGGQVTLSAVNFAYAEQQVFRNFSLSIPAGQKIGIVGRSGAGKTSLVSLLLRQYDVQGGVIAIDGQDVRSVSQQSLRRSIALVPQDPSLFHRTIRENIRYGSPGSTDADVERAAQLAQAHVFISAMPKAYDTLVGERGVKLSGGQRQRIAIARAILRNAPILILDEATSALDSESEAAIQNGLRELMRQKTVIAIAHRLSTLKLMDRIVVLDDGRIVEDGTHEELLGLNGIYTKLWESQVRGFIQE